MIDDEKELGSRSPQLPACMSTRTSVADNNAELSEIRELSERMGRNPLLIQASTGNSSIKLDGALWIKASGKWMADAKRDDFLIPLDLADVQQCVKKEVDPAERYAHASVETAMHAVLPQRVVLHVHSVNAIAWAVQKNAPLQLQKLLDGLCWQWIPYVPSGLPLAQEIGKALSVSADTDLFVLGNHGLVVAGDDCSAVEALLSEVEQRLAICPRQAHPADYATLAEIADRSSWELPDDDAVHALGTDAISQAILMGGLLYPCQAIFSNANTPGLFHSVPSAYYREQRDSRYSARPFLIIEGSGVVLNRTIMAAECAMISGLAQVIQRISSSAPIRYLTEAEISNISSTAAYRYRELANASHCSTAR
ncbi:MAG TPA: class II aldolase/adducin family protein [Terriglobales bacterium]|nr:class II aldolase/adducin family protein [Terriglobales bacterium]